MLPDMCTAQGVVHQGVIMFLIDELVAMSLLHAEHALPQLLYPTKVLDIGNGYSKRR
jgi:hypothetical protein